LESLVSARTFFPGCDTPPSLHLSQSLGRRCVQLGVRLVLILMFLVLFNPHFDRLLLPRGFPRSSLLSLPAPFPSCQHPSFPFLLSRVSLSSIVLPPQKSVADVSRIAFSFRSVPLQPNYHPHCCVPLFVFPIFFHIPCLFFFFFVFPASFLFFFAFFSDFERCFLVDLLRPFIFLHSRLHGQMFFPLRRIRAIPPSHFFSNVSVVFPLHLAVFFCLVWQVSLLNIPLPFDVSARRLSFLFSPTLPQSCPPHHYDRLFFFDPFFNCPVFSGTCGSSLFPLPSSLMELVLFGGRSFFLPFVGIFLFLPMVLFHLPQFAHHPFCPLLSFPFNFFSPFSGPGFFPFFFRLFTGIWPRPPPHASLLAVSSWPVVFFFFQEICKSQKLSLAPPFFPPGFFNSFLPRCPSPLVLNSAFPFFFRR